MESTEGDASMSEADAGADEEEVSPQREVISMKERARLYRQQAYQKAKAWRAADPKVQALKEVVKQRRRDLYQQLKTQRKAAESAQKGQRASGVGGDAADPARGVASGERTDGRRPPPVRRVREPKTRAARRGMQPEGSGGTPAPNVAEAKSKRRDELLQRVRLATTQAADLVANDVTSSDEEPPPPARPSKRY